MKKVLQNENGYLYIEALAIIVVVIVLVGIFLSLGEITNDYAQKSSETVIGSSSGL